MPVALDATDPIYAGGVKFDGSTNDTAAMVSVLAAAGAGNCKTVVVPAGKGIVNADVLQGPPDLHLTGQGSIFETPDATGDVLRVDGGSLIENVGFCSSVQRTAGGFLRTNGLLKPLDPAVFRLVSAKRGFRSFVYDSSITALRIIDCCSSEETPYTGGGLSAGVHHYGGGILFLNDYIRGTSAAEEAGGPGVFAAVYVEEGNLSLRGGQLLRGCHGIVMGPSTGDLYAAIQHVWIDNSAGSPIWLNPVNGGRVQFVNISDCPWLAPNGANASGIEITGNGKVNILKIDGNQIVTYRNNQGSGIYLGSPVSGAASITNNVIGMKNYGFAWGFGAAAGVNNIQYATNAVVDAGGNAGGGPVAVIQAGSNNYSIVSNHGFGTSGGISDSGAGPHKLVASNL